VRGKEKGVRESEIRGERMRFRERKRNCGEGEKFEKEREVKYT